MKLLHTADWHLGARLQGRSRLPEQHNLLADICGIAERENVDLVVIAGDIFDTYSPPVEAERLYFETLARLADGGRRAVAVIGGNHDSPDRLIASDPIARSHGVITLGRPTDEPGLFDLGSGRIACIESTPSFARLRVASGSTIALILLPYPSESRLFELLSDSIDDEVGARRNYNDRLREIMEGLADRFIEGEPTAIVSHLFVDGGREGGSERPIQVGGAYSVHYSTFPTAGYIALGHLHAPQEYRTPSGSIVRYSGSILQNGFGEAGQKKSVTIVEFTDEQVHHRDVPLNGGRPLVRIATSSLADLRSRLDALEGDPWIGIDFTLVDGVAPEDLDDIRRSNTSIVDVAFLHDRAPADAAEGAQTLLQLTLDEQFRRYVAETFNEPCDDDLVRLFLELTEEARSGPDS